MCARFRSLAPMYYRGAQAAIIVYDCTSNVRNGQGGNGQGARRERAGGRARAREEERKDVAFGVLDVPHMSLSQCPAFLASLHVPTPYASIPLSSPRLGLVQRCQGMGQGAGAATSHGHRDGAVRKQDRPQPAARSAHQGAQAGRRGAGWGRAGWDKAGRVGGTGAGAGRVGAGARGIRKRNACLCPDTRPV